MQTNYNYSGSGVQHINPFNSLPDMIEILVAVHGFKGLPAFGGAVGDQGSEVPGVLR